MTDKYSWDYEFDDIDDYDIEFEMVTDNKNEIEVSVDTESEKDLSDEIDNNEAEAEIEKPSESEEEPKLIINKDSKKKMIALVCEMCRSNDLVKIDGLFVCQNCGTKYSVEEARNMMEGKIDISGSTVKIDNSNKIRNLFTLARRARGENDFSRAANYYEQILLEDPDSWEACFYSVFFRVKDCKTKEYARNATELGRAFKLSFGLLNSNEPDESVRARNYKKLADFATTLIYDLKIDANNQYIISQKTPAAKQNYRDIVSTCGNAVFLIGDSYYFINDKKSAAEYYKTGMNILGSDFTNPTVLARIREVYPSYQKGGCYIATCVYESYDCPEVWTLRRYRDDILAKSYGGMLFIKTYYAISPTLVKIFGEMKWFRCLFQKVLDYIVLKLNEGGIDDSPYTDK